MIIKFSEISDNKLFQDYLYNFDNVKRFYNYNFRDEDSYTSVFNNVVKKNPDITEKVNEIIKKQYQKVSPSDKTNANIAKLSKKNTVAIFTGQQLGLVGGPLYTIYKIFTAIKLSEYLSEKFTGFNFVPVFWLAGDDHDFEEVTNLKFIDKNNELKKIYYYDFNNKEANKGSIGNLKFGNSINDFKTEIKSSIRETEFSKKFFKLLDKILVEGKTFKDSFFDLIFKIFDDAGLIIFNPQDSEIKELLKPIFLKELNDFNIHSSEVLLTSADLDENYHTQVKVKPINLFYSNETGRHLIEPVNDEFRLKGKRKHITKEEMFELLEKFPERFSPNVLLRPVCQDYLFPTGFYIAGPGEISYFAQVMPLYKNYNVSQPIIYPRASATIVESNIAKILMKFNLSVKDFFAGEKTLKENVLNTLSSNNVETIFYTATKSIEESLTKLTEQLSFIDNTIGEVSNKNKEKILNQLKVLQTKALKGEENKYSAAMRQLKKAQNILYPNNNLQERELSIVNFINKYGTDFFDWLFNELEINEFEHQILEL